MQDWLQSQDPATVGLALEAYAKANPDKADDAEFGVWFNLVDRKVKRMFGVSLNDLADAPYRDLFDAGISPREAVPEILEYDDVFSEALLYL